MRCCSTIFTLLLLVGSLVGSLAAQVRIAEFMANNNLVLADAEGDWPDWIELENVGTSSVNLGGWYLTDSANKPTKWQLPSPTTLGAGQRLVVFASGKDRAVAGKRLHTNFKLKSDGEYLALLTPSRSVVSRFAPTFPPQFPDVSYGFDSSGVGYFPSSTPGAANGSTQPVVGLAQFTPLAPKNTDPVVVTAELIHDSKTPPNSVSLRYRVNFGSESAVALRDDGLGGDLRAGDHLWTGTSPRGSPAGSMLRWRVRAAFGAFVAPGPLFRSPTNSPQYFGALIADPSVTSVLPILRWWVQSPLAAETRTGTRCAVAYEGAFYDNVFVRRRGGSSNNWPKKNFKFDFNRGHALLYAAGAHEAEELNANSTWSDKSFVRQILSFEIYDRAGAAGCESFPFRMEQNGKFHSAAIFVEQPDERLLEREGLDPRGALYKMFNTLTSATNGVEKKTRTWEGRGDLQALVNGVILTGKPLERFLFDHVDLPAVLDYIAATVLIHDQDHVHKNHFLYRDTEGDREWRFLPWDKDLTIGRNYFKQYGVLNDVIWASHDPASHPLFGDRNHTNPGGRWNRLIDACHGTPRIRAMFLRRLRTLMDEILQSGTTPRALRSIEQRLDALKSQMSKDVALDQGRWGIPSYWNRTIDFAKGLGRVENLYFNPRRKHLFVTHGSSATGIIPKRQAANLALAFGHIESSPTSGDQDEEYIEVVNCNKVAVDVSGWKLGGGVKFEFEPGTVIGPGEVLHVSPVLRKFRARTTGPRGNLGLFVVGPYTGRLDPAASLWIKDGNRLVTSNGGFAYTMTTTGQGDVRISVTGAKPKIELFTLVSITTSHPLGCGPLFGVGLDALWVADLPLGTHPLHVLTDASGSYVYSSGSGVVPRGLTLDSCVVEVDRVARTLRSSAVRRVKF